MKSVLLRGPILTQSGYGVHCRQVAKWLLDEKKYDVKFQIMPWGDTPWILNRNQYDGMIGKIFDASSTNLKGFDVSLQLQLPNEWDNSIATTNIGLTAAIETDISNPDWLNHCKRMDHVIFPSKHAMNSIGNVENCSIVPEAFPNEILNNDAKIDLNIDTEFNFLLFGQITGNNPENDRKNIFYTLKWMCETFSDDPNVGIVIKTNISRNTKIDKNITTNIFKNLLKEVRKGPYPKIHLLHGTTTEKEIGALYRHPKIKALVSLTRGEGFGLPLLEAAACDLPIIATNWSAHTEFLNIGKFIQIDYKLQQIHQTRIDGKLFMPNAKWAQASEEDFKKRIKKFVQSPQIPKEWAMQLGEKIREQYNIDAIKTQYSEKLSKWL